MRNFEIVDLPELDLLSEMKMMMKEGMISWNDGNQIGITTSQDGPDDIHYCIGSLGISWDASTSEMDHYGNTKLTVPDKPTIRSEFDFNRLCSVYRGTLFEEVYDMLTERYKIGRIRLMKLEPKTCLSWHYDTNIKRLHFPIKTQKQCYMVIEDEVLHLKENTWYKADTTKYHTVFNAGFESRIHLVAVIEEK